MAWDKSKQIDEESCHIYIYHSIGDEECFVGHGIFQQYALAIVTSQLLRWPVHRYTVYVFLAFLIDCPSALLLSYTALFPGKHIDKHRECGAIIKRRIMYNEPLVILLVLQDAVRRVQCYTVQVTSHGGRFVSPLHKDRVALTIHL